MRDYADPKAPLTVSSKESTVWSNTHILNAQLYKNAESMRIDDSHMKRTSMYAACIRKLYQMHVELSIE